MKYRPFGRLDWQVSALGMGCMRLPIVGGDSAQIDQDQAIAMIRYAIDHGVNYFDTAYPYHGGQSERVLGLALKDGYRERVRIATKLPTWAVETADDYDRYLNEQLARLGVDHIDFYLFHGLRAPRWEIVNRLNLLQRAEAAVADGRIGHIGFSFHDNFEMFKTIIDGYGKWTLCQIQYNYMNEDEQAGTRGLEYAAAQGLAVVVMEPLLGGRLVNPPAEVQALWDTAPIPRAPVHWGLQWLWNKPEVSLALSGMSTMQQVQQNIELAGQSAVGLLSPEELALVGRVRDRYRELCPIPCTQCRYCMPCPNGVDIPRNFEVFNVGIMYNTLTEARRHYQRILEEARASACIQCRLCEEKCPQSIPISEWMPLVHQVLGEGQPLEACTRPA